MFKIVLFVIGVSCAQVFVVDSEALNYNISDNKIRELSTASTDESSKVLETESGPVRGYENNGVIGFYDIPYGTFTAQKPFQEASKPEISKIVLENTEHTSRCPQLNNENAYVGTIDCLTLSIFKPINATDLHVLFHVHDSEFDTGSGDPSKYIPTRLVSESIIVVLPNYRLGPLGFLCLQNKTAPGNAALKDLTLALEWTFNNVEKFGGNSSNIVISGSGAAGALVEFLLLSNTSRKFISKAIAESGFTLSPWALDRNPLHVATDLIEKLRKSDINTNRKLQKTNISFEEVEIEKLIKAANDINLRPCVELEEGFLNETPWSLLKNQKYDVHYMLGSANQAAMANVLKHTKASLSELDRNASLLLPHDLKFKSAEEMEKIGNRVRSHYFKDSNITCNNLEKLSQCLSDSNYAYPGIQGARLLLKGGADIFFYEYSLNRGNSIDGAKRGDYVSQVFNKPDDTTDNGNTIPSHITKLWVNFIKTGNPSIEDVSWTALKVAADTEEEWMAIGDLISLQKGFHIERMKLWNDIYQNYYIERNLGFKLKPPIYFILSGLILLLDSRDSISM